MEGHEVEDVSTATTEAAKTIRAIDKTTVHRICSGQVVLTLATAVKELVENSLDAGATSVEVRLKDHGATLLEVSDNGAGVEERDFEGLTLKHHTSKIQDFGDLVGVKTFGFRGEALSSLCALSDLSITTRHASHEVATRLTYDHNGKLTTRTLTSRQVGTTVSLQGLFSTLPVRHKEFLRNIKREFNKMVQVLYSYCLISTGVRITCTNQNDKGKKTVVVSTSGHPTVRENISSIFGSKQASSLLEFQQESATSDVLEEFGIASETTGREFFSLEGAVSSCTHGEGRSSADRQFYYINSRPCDPTKVMKLVNEVYHQYNRHQFPCVVLNIKLQEEDVDINVTPDKRQILVSHEKLLLATIKTSLLQLYEHIPSTYSVQNTSLTPSRKALVSPSPSNPSSPTLTPPSGKLSALSQKFGRRSSGSPHPSTPPTGLTGMKRSFSHSGVLGPSTTNKQPKLLNFFKKPSPDHPEHDECSNGENVFPSEACMEGVDAFPSPTQPPLPSPADRLLQDTEMETKPSNRVTMSEHSCSATPEAPGLVECAAGGEGADVDEVKESHSTLQHNGVHARNGDSKLSFDSSDIRSTSQFTKSHEPHKLGATVPNGGHSSPSLTSDMKGLGSRTPLHRTLSTSTPLSSCKKVHSATNDFLNSLRAKKSQIACSKGVENSSAKKEISETCDFPQQDEVEVVHEDFANVQALDQEGGEGGISSGSQATPKKVIMCEEYDPSEFREQRRCKIIPFSMESLKESLRATRETGTSQDLVRRFRAKISPTDNTAAEDELRKEISKDMFAKMEILGQFNLGFIITRLGQDLFIIDQHATDEKYNFETLQQTCTLQNQRLIIPQTLELTAVNEATLLDNLAIFQKNGFEFSVDEDRPVGRRMSLVSMPISRSWEFGRGDVEELIFMLSDAPGTMCRPSRVRAMFASRACRKSVMIGTALTVAQMSRLVAHMGEIEQPWNCPHGRPTMRHLVNLDMLVSL